MEPRWSRPTSSVLSQRCPAHQMDPLQKRFAGSPLVRVCRHEATLFGAEHGPQLRLLAAQPRTGAIPGHRIDEECRVAADRAGPPREVLEPGPIVHRQQQPTEEGTEAVCSHVPDLGVSSPPQEWCRGAEYGDNDALDEGSGQ